MANPCDVGAAALTKTRIDADTASTWWNYTYFASYA